MFGGKRVGESFRGSIKTVGFEWEGRVRGWKIGDHCRY
jgi:hypothetical protein